MDIGSIFLILAIIIIVVMVITQPFTGKLKTGHLIPDGSLEQEIDLDRDYSVLRAEHDRTLNALQELDFDFTLGKISEEDYPKQRIILLQRGAETLRKLDEFDVNLQEQSAEARIESFVSNPLAELPLNAGKKMGGGDPELEVLIAERRRALQEKTAGFCPKCGKPSLSTDKFCSKCGTTLNQWKR